MKPQAGRAGSWYRVTAAADDDEATIYLYDAVSWFGVTADDFVRELAALQVATIQLRLNSPGGLVWDGVAIHNALREHPAAVHVHVDGVAASIASVIAMAGDTVTMGRGTQMMIHNPRAIVLGEADDMRKEAELLDRVADDIAGFYRERAGGTLAGWRERMAAETWYSAAEAVEAGLADQQAGDAPEDVARHDLTGFKYAGREKAPAPGMSNRSRLIRARARALTKGARTCP